GPSAHSFALADTVARRWWNEPRITPWERRVAAGERPVAGEELLGPRELATEVLMLGLRTTAGVDLDLFAARFGLDLLGGNDALVERLVGDRLLEVRSLPEGRRLVPTVRGLGV